MVTDVGILRLNDYRAAEVLTGIDPDRAECVAAGLVASMTAGITQWCVEAVTAHLRIREQFGKVIGTFQALQHSAAMLLINSELATAAAWDAVRAGANRSTSTDIAAAAAAVIAISPRPIWCSMRSRCSAPSVTPGNTTSTCTGDALPVWRHRSARQIAGRGVWVSSRAPSSVTCRSTSATPTRNSGRGWPKRWMPHVNSATTNPDAKATTKSSRPGRNAR